MRLRPSSATGLGPASEAEGHQLGWALQGIPVGREDFSTGPGIIWAVTALPLNGGAKAIVYCVSVQTGHSPVAGGCVGTWRAVRWVTGWQVPDSPW